MGDDNINHHAALPKLSRKCDHKLPACEGSGSFNLGSVNDASAARHNPNYGAARLVAHAGARLGPAEASPYRGHWANELCPLAVSIIQRG